MKTLNPPNTTHRNRLSRLLYNVNSWDYIWPTDWLSINSSVIEVNNVTQPNPLLFLQLFTGNLHPGEKLKVQPYSLSITSRLRQSLNIYAVRSSWTYKPLFQPASQPRPPSSTANSHPPGFDTITGCPTEICSHTNTPQLQHTLLKYWSTCTVEGGRGSRQAIVHWR